MRILCLGSSVDNFPGSGTNKNWPNKWQSVQLRNQILNSLSTQSGKSSHSWELCSLFYYCLLVQPSGFLCTDNEVYHFPSISTQSFSKQWGTLITSNNTWHEPLQTENDNGSESRWNLATDFAEYTWKVHKITNLHMCRIFAENDT
jgi:hypothetical protein